MDRPDILLDHERRLSTLEGIMVEVRDTLRRLEASNENLSSRLKASSENLSSRLEASNENLSRRVDHLSDRVDHLSDRFTIASVWLAGILIGGFAAITAAIITIL